MSLLHVLFKVAGSEYALPYSDVLHMETFAGATRVPGAPSYVAGLMQVRGRVLPVIDLRVRFGLDPQPSTPDSRVVVVQSGKRPLALLADSAREVLKIDPSEYRDAPEMVSESENGFVKSVARAGNRLVMLIDLQKVIGEERIDGA
jgi:purine-binding chemotaxis protein CheW